MFALCHFKENEDNFILFDKEDFKEVTEHMNIELQKELSFEEFKKDYSSFPLMNVNDLILRILNRRNRTNTHVLDELGISCWITLENEYNLIQEKKSNLSRSQREIVEAQYNSVVSA